MRASGEAFTARQAGQESRGQDLMDETRDVLDSAGIRLVLALLKVGRIPCPPRRPRPAAVPRLPASTSLADEFKNMGLNVGPACAVGH